MDYTYTKPTADVSGVPAEIVAAYRNWREADQQASNYRGETRGARIASTRRWNKFTRLCTAGGFDVPQMARRLSAGE